MDIKELQELHSAAETAADASLAAYNRAVIVEREAADVTPEFAAMDRMVAEMAWRADEYAMDEIYTALVEAQIPAAIDRMAA